MLSQHAEGIRQRQSNKRMEEGDAVERLEHLNGMLQEKLFTKEGDIVEMERRLMEKEELIKELA